MKKILTIGRGTQCDICINDSTDVLSRNHAILEIKSNNKYFIIDQSRNGTYVNGMRITPNEKVPITRDDVISFAHIRELDWSLVPKNNNLSLWLGLVAAVVLVLLIVVLLLFYNKSTDDNLNLLGKGALYEQTENGSDGVLNPNPIDETDSSTTEDDKANATDSNQPEKQAPKKKDPVDAIL